MKRRVAFKTVGCRLNQHETESIATQFRRAGYEIGDFSDAADVYIINTCTVTGQSDQKSRQYLHRAAGRKPDPVVVVTGCMATRNRETLEAQSDATYVVDNARKSSIFALVDGHFRGEVVHPRDMRPDFFDYPVSDRVLRTRSTIKVQDGCDNACAFCIIPRVRGTAVSRPHQDVIRNVREVVDRGALEVVITGVNIGRYHDGQVNIDGLLESILELPGDFRVRVSSLEPDGFGERFMDLLSHEKMTPHLHLCLQSGSERILRRMRRMYTLTGYLEMIARIRQIVPDINLTTDALVGFPGETDDDFEATLAVLKDIRFSHIHTFKYSMREGTRAAGMEEQIPEAVKASRSAAVRELSLEQRNRYLSGMVGRRQRLLVERVHGGVARGYGQHYVPLELADSDIGINRFVDVMITEKSIRGERPVLRAEAIAS